MKKFKTLADFKNYLDDKKIRVFDKKDGEYKFVYITGKQALELAVDISKRIAWNPITKK